MHACMHAASQQHHLKHLQLLMILKLRSQHAAIIASSRYEAFCGSQALPSPNASAQEAHSCPAAAICHQCTEVHLKRGLNDP